MGSSWIDTLAARREVAAEPQPEPRPLPGTISAARPAAPAPADMTVIRTEVGQMVRDEVAAAMADISTMLRDHLGIAPTPPAAPQSPPEPPPAPQVVSAAETVPAAPAAPWTPVAAPPAG